METSVMLGAGRHDQDIGGSHVEGPMGYAIRGIQQHSDNEIVITETRSSQPRPKTSRC